MARNPRSRAELVAFNGQNQRATLLDLPNETLRDIFLLFRPRLRDSGWTLLPIFTAAEIQLRLDGSRALARLCRVSKRISSVSTEILYQRIGFPRAQPFQNEFEDYYDMDTSDIGAQWMVDVGNGIIPSDEQMEGRSKKWCTPFSRSLLANAKLATARSRFQYTNILDLSNWGVGPAILPLLAGALPNLEGLSLCLMCSWKVADLNGLAAVFEGMHKSANVGVRRRLRSLAYNMSRVLEHASRARAVEALFIIKEIQKLEITVRGDIRYLQDGFCGSLSVKALHLVNVPAVVAEWLWVRLASSPSHLNAITTDMGDCWPFLISSDLSALCHLAWNPLDHSADLSPLHRATGLKILQVGETLMALGDIETLVSTLPPTVTDLHFLHPHPLVYTLLRKALSHSKTFLSSLNYVSATVNIRQYTCHWSTEAKQRLVQEIRALEALCEGRGIQFMRSFACDCDVGGDLKCEVWLSDAFRCYLTEQGEKLKTDSSRLTSEEEYLEYLDRHGQE